MKQHRKLKRQQVLKYGWKKVLLMTASEFSRAFHLFQNGGRKESTACLLRAKELLGVVEIDTSLPYNVALQLLPFTKKIVADNPNFKRLYEKCSSLALS